MTHARTLITRAAVIRTLTASLLMCGLAVFFAASPASAQTIEVDAMLNERSLDGVGSGDALVINANDELLLDLQVTNTGAEPTMVSFVRLEGTAVGIRFFTYDTGVFLPIEPGATENLLLPIRFLDLDSQADGFVRSTLRLFDDDRKPLASQSFVADVRGNSTAALRLFAIAALVFAIVSIGFTLYLASRRRLHKNRMVRGFHFSYSGLAVGLLIALFLPIFRIVALAPVGWFFALALPTLIGFGIGYLTPNWLSAWSEWEDARDEAIASKDLGLDTASSSGS